MKKSILIILSSFSFMYGAGGPPMLTDGTGTPSDGSWELNIAYKSETTNGSKSYQQPSFDLNYGYGDNIQLKFETALVTAKNSSRADEEGIGNAKIGVKWRFYENELDGVSISVYPQYTFLPIKKNLSRGLASVDEALFLPIEITKRIDNFSFTAEAGYYAVKNGSDFINSGFLVGFEVLPKLELFAEVYRTAQTNQDNETIFANGGFLYNIASEASFMFSSGTELTSHKSKTKLCFIGLQLLF